MSNSLVTTAEILGFLPESGNVNQVPYHFGNVVVLYGIPSRKLGGLDSVRVRYLQPREIFHPSLGGGGCFTSNRNTSAEIELTFLQGAFSVAHVEIFSLTGISMPLIISDLSTGATSGVVCTACRVTDIGEWSRGEEADPVAITLTASRAKYFHGLRLPVWNK